MTYHHDRDMKHHDRDKAITIGIWSIASQKCQSGSLTIHVTIVSMRLQLVRISSSFHMFILGCSRSTVTIVSQHLKLVTKLHSSSLKSGVLTISRHDREHASQARDHQVSARLHFINKSGTLTISRHDREPAIPARDLQLVNFQRSLGRSQSDVTIVSMHVKLVIIIRLSQKSTLGRSRSTSRSWACHFSSWLLADLNYNG